LFDEGQTTLSPDGLKLSPATCRVAIGDQRRTDRLGMGKLLQFVKRLIELHINEKSITKEMHYVLFKQ